MKDAEKKIDRSLIIKRLKDRLLKKWEADKLSYHSTLPGEKSRYLKTIKN
jgi:hypothetical protein